MDDNRSIGAECFINAVSTGETLHPQLLSTKPLSQNYNSSKGTFSPDWTDSGNSPVVYLSQLNGSREIPPIGTPRWFYNNAELSFDSNGNCTTTGYGNLFKSKPLTLNGVTYNAALYIIGNLASSQNIDIDLIGYKGQAELSGVLFDVELALPVKIAEWSGSGYFGQITFKDVTNASSPVDGVKVITKKGQKLQATAHLYGDAELQATQFYCRWYLNGTLKSGASTGNTFNVTEGDVTDHAVLECRYYEDSACTKLITVVSEDIDDQQDPEFMYIQNQKYAIPANSSTYAWTDWISGKNVSLRKGEKCKYQVWVGRVDDATVDTTWSTFMVMFRGKNGTVLRPAQLSALTGLTVNGDWYTLAKSSGKGITGEIPFDEVAAQGDGVAMYIKAQ